MAICWSPLATPILNNVGKQDNFNLSPKSEKAFEKDKRFYIPLHVFNVLETLTWIWALILMSDQVEFDNIWFYRKPKTTFQYLVFSFVLGNFASLNIIGGHELIHKKETYNKVIGTFTFTKFLYTHFLDDHIKGHHKHVGTPLDPVTARKDETFYAFFFRSAMGQHITTWKREVKRIKKLKGDDVPLALMLFNNKMTWCFVLHVTLLSTIYFFLGWQSLKHQFVYTF